MTVRIGLGIAADTVRALLIRRGSVVWTAEAALNETATIQDAITSVLSTIPIRRSARPMLSAAVWGTRAQARVVTGLPNLVDPTMLAAVIRENIGSFFLKNGVPLVAAGVRVKAPGTVLAAVVDRPVVDAIQQICRHRGWRLGSIAPTPVVLPLALTGDSILWIDGPIRSLITSSGGVIESIKTEWSRVAEATPAGQPVDGLATLQVDAHTYADAYGAALLSQNEPLAISDTTIGLEHGVGAHRKLLAPAVLLACSILLLVLSPMAAVVSRVRADFQIEALHESRWNDVTGAFNQLHRVTTMLEELSAFASSKPNLSALLADIAQALPQNAVVTELEIHDGQGRILALSPEPSTIVAALGNVAGLDSLQVSREVTVALTDRVETGVEITFRLQTRSGHQ
jgi:hypothetical protein